MGKAEIISHLGDGQYSVKLLRDQTWLDGRIGWLAGRITELQAERVPLAEALAAAIAEFEAAETVIEQLQKNIAVSIARVDLARIDAAIVSAQKRKSQLESAVSTLAADTRSVWCADLTTTLAGEYPTAEVNGTSDHAILMPGTMPTEYTGDLAPVISMTVAQAAFNFAIHPGWQRWTPTFRLATITALSVAQDTCSVALAQAKDRYQSLDINASETLDNVPISYMTCDSKAFVVGDEVLVMFQGQDWATPAVIGFKEQPKDCGGHMILIVASVSGAEAFAYDIIDETVLVEKTTLAGVVSALSAMGFDGTEQKLSPTATVQTVAAIGSTQTRVAVDYLPTLWAWNDNGFWRNLVMPRNVLSVSGTTAITKDSAGRTDTVNEITASLELVQSPYSEEYRAHYLYDNVSHGIYRISPVTGTLAINYLLHSVFDHQPPDDETMSTDDTTARDYLWTRRQYYGTGHLLYSMNLGDVNHDTGAIISNFMHLVHFMHSRSGVAANGSGGVVFEGGVDYLHAPSLSMNHYSYHHCRLFARVVPKDLNAWEAKAMELINFERSQRNLTPYVWNHVLARTAAGHSQDMADNLFMSHVGSDGSTYDDRLEAAGFRKHATTGRVTDIEGGLDILYDSAGENVASTIGDPYNTTPPHNIDSTIFFEVLAQPQYADAGHAEEVVAGWMASLEGHRELILDETEEYTDMGISAILASDGAVRWTLAAAIRYHHWPGFGCVDTLPVVDYINANFNFTDAESFTENDGYWFIPGNKTRDQVADPHWLLRPANVEGNVSGTDLAWFGDKPVMPEKKEVEYFLL